VGEPPAEAPQFVPLERRDVAMIVPLIKRSVKTSEGAIRLPERNELMAEPLVGDLHVFYAFDLPGLFKFVSRNDCEALGLDVAELRALSVRNLIKRRRKPEIKQADTGVMLILDGDLEASLLLVDHIWAQLAPQIPGDLIAAVPTRDVLAVTGTDVDDGLAVLSSAVSRVWENPATDPKLLLTRSLLKRQGPSWQLLDCDS